MTTREPEDPPPRPAWARDHLANERTMLAWVRTALTFMAFGVAVAKLGVLLRIATIDHPEMIEELPSAERSELLGVGLITFGGVLAGIAMIRSRRWAHRIDPTFQPPSQRTLTFVAAATIALAVGLGLYVLL